ncbi:hypothetical protein PC119_g7839 [Phytophthora cactorum]|nr:hypothetical protein PC114_g8395 [Phytophthora cactorum]KAG3026322.1 hypothetical protein PC119_g7839 [Phytophthora cactorum]KAG3176359.1 hypothetical protein PC128_g17333 [Phytophthora cactorum]
MGLSTVKVILVFAPLGRASEARRQPQRGMAIGEDVLRTLGVDSKGRLTLRLRKSLYGLRQAGRLWSKLLHARLEEAGFTRCVTDMCPYYKRKGGNMTLVGVYVDDLLVTASRPSLVEEFFASMSVLSVKDLGVVKKFLGMRVELDDDR